VSGISLAADSTDATDGESDESLARAFLGPTEPAELERLLAADTAAPEPAPYGRDWQTPLRAEQRRRAGDRLLLYHTTAPGADGAAPNRTWDGREGTGLDAHGLPAIAWHAVNDAPVEVAIQVERPGARLRRRQTVKRLVAPFAIARYPVTVLQHQAFEDAMAQDPWPWTELQTAGSVSPGKSYRQWGATELEGKRGHYPVVDVTWLDAWMFCRWLTERLRQTAPAWLGERIVRMPDELEWQLAATANAREREYPWGPEPPTEQYWRANIRETGPGAVTAVGSYPAGAAPCGALDMAGTVWEWCQNNFDKPHDCAKPRLKAMQRQKDRRSLRGGSWYVARRDARAAVRNRGHPDGRDVNIGFRLCVAPPIE